jgi:hypothetical protein
MTRGEQIKEQEQEQTAYGGYSLQARSSKPLLAPSPRCTRAGATDSSRLYRTPLVHYLITLMRLGLESHGHWTGGSRLVLAQ